MPFETLLQPIADALGISISVLGIGILVSAGVSVGITAFTMTGSILISLIGTGGVLFGGAFLGILPLWIPFVYSMVGISTVLFSRFGGVGLGSKRSLPEAEAVVKSVKEDARHLLVVNIEQHSKKLSQYINNLDMLLGIKTVNQPSIKGLKLTAGNELLIGGGYDWYIYDKHPSKEAFTIVGLYKGNPNKCTIYHLGRYSDEPRIPYLSKSNNSKLRVRRRDSFK